MRAHLLALLLVVSALAAGCSRPEGSEEGEGGPVASTSDSCGAQFAGPPGLNAPLVTSLQDDPEAAVTRLAGVLGEEVRGAPEVGEGELSWPATNGTFTYRRAEDFAQVAFTPEGAWAPGDADELLAQVREAFSVPPDGIEPIDVAGGAGLQQRLGDLAVAPAGASLVAGEGGGLAFGPFYELRADLELLPEARIVEVAEAYAACVGATAGAPEPAFVVVDSALTRPVPLEGGGCEGRVVLVDAETASVRGERGACEEAA